MDYRIVPFEDRFIEQAVGLFAERYAEERRESPLLPAEPMGGWGQVAHALRDADGLPGVLALRGGETVGYLRTCARFAWKGQNASLCREYAHAATGEDRSMIYQLMYAALAEQWVVDGSHLHLLCHFAGDQELGRTLFRLGFGAIVAENLRDLSPVAPQGCLTAGEEPDAQTVRELAREHARYYRSSPIFLPKEEHELAVDPADALFVAREAGAPVAYFVVGECEGRGEGLLLRHTHSAQIKSAYAKPEVRRRGVGAALLGACVQWSRARGFERLFVEHETANIPGARFWGRHFGPFLYASMRYVDSGL